MAAHGSGVMVHVLPNKGETLAADVGCQWNYKMVVARGLETDAIPQPTWDASGITSW
jgi:hypothetical protein